MPRMRVSILSTLIAVTLPLAAQDGAGNALWFDGANDFAHVPNSPVFRPGAGSWTVEGWVLLESFSPVNVVAMCADGDFANGWRLDVEPPAAPGWGVGFTVDGGGRIQIASGILPPPHEWHHVAGVYDGVSASLYLDGNLVASGSGTLPRITPMANLLMGRYDQACCGTHYLDGALDEIRIWNVARPQAQIQASLGRCLTGAEPGLVGYWRFDEPSGQVLVDSSTNDNDGVLGADSNAAPDDPVRVQSDAPIICSDDDDDGDGVSNESDNCPNHPNLTQANADADGFGAACDCDDTSPSTYPGAPEVCDGYDNDCNVVIDDNLSCPMACDLPEPTGTARRLTASPFMSSYPSVVWTGTEYGVVWHDDRDGNQEIYFARLDVAGQKVGVDVRVTSDPAVSTKPVIVWTGSEYGVIWYDSREGDVGIFFVPVSSDGEIVEPAKRVIDGSVAHGHAATAASLLWNGTEYGIAWMDSRGGEDIYFARFDAYGNRMGGDVRVSPDPAWFEEYPALVWNGSVYGVVWVVGYDRLHFATLEVTGAKRSQVSWQSACGYTYGLSAVWTGSEFGVACAAGSSGIGFTRLDGNGQLLEQRTIPTHTSTNTFAGHALTFSGSEYAIALKESSGSELFLVRFDANGNNIGTDVRINDEASQPCEEELFPWTQGLSPWLARNGSSYLAVWCDARDDNEEIYSVPVACNCVDTDADGVSSCNDCDDDNVTVFPGAPELCDGLDNDCDDVVPTAESNADGDPFRLCEGDCDDQAPGVHPDAPEICNLIDDNCNALVDEDGLGQDTDGDGVHNLCDNCREDINPSQFDVDADHVGNSCDNCVLAPNANQGDLDLDDRGDACDNCPGEANFFQDDYDGDSAGDACDNCFFDWNPAQADSDSDHEGDWCDLNDGMIYIRFHQPEYVEWQEETGFSSWNNYRGDLQVLRSQGLYTQNPSLVPLAEHHCDLSVPWAEDADPPPGAAVFFLTTGNITGTGIESGIGANSAGIERQNSNPCP